MHNIVKGIMKREKVYAENLAKKMGINPISFRRMLRGDIKMDAEILNSALDELGYKIMIVKKEDIV